MDFSSLASTAATTLAAIFKKHPAVEQFQNDFIQGLVDWVKPLFLKDSTPLDDLKGKPDEPLNQQEVATKINKHLNNAPESAAILEQLIKKIMDSGELPKAGNAISVVGNDNQIVQGVQGSTININKP